VIFWSFSVDDQDDMMSGTKWDEPSVICRRSRASVFLLSCHDGGDGSDGSDYSYDPLVLSPKNGRYYSSTHLESFAAERRGKPQRPRYNMGNGRARCRCGRSLERFVDTLRLHLLIASCFTFTFSHETYTFLWCTCCGQKTEVDEIGNNSMYMPVRIHTNHHHHQQQQHQ
jgi:hypothetical protein